MAQVVWAEPAIADLEAIAEYIALRDRRAARLFVRRVMDHVAQLAEHPESGPVLPELDDLRYRQIVEPPVRVIYRPAAEAVFVLHVVRGERMLDELLLLTRDE